MLNFLNQPKLPSPQYFDRYKITYFYIVNFSIFKLNSLASYGCFSFKVQFPCRISN